MERKEKQSKGMSRWEKQDKCYERRIQKYESIREFIYKNTQTNQLIN